MKTPVETQTIASVKIARPAYFARLFHIRIIRFACVTAKTKNGIAMSDAEREVEQQHRVEERGVAGEGRDVDRVGGDQAERNEQEPVEAPLPGLQDAGGPGGRRSFADMRPYSSAGGAASPETRLS